MLRQVSQTSGFESSSQSSVSSPSEPTHSFWLQRNTLKLCLRTGRPWQCQSPQCPTFRHFNPFMCSVSLGKCTILSGTGIDTSYGGKTWSLHLPECSRRGDGGFRYSLERMTALLLDPRFTVLFHGLFPICPSIFDTCLKNKQKT